jgi:hypothetical protein
VAGADDQLPADDAADDDAAHDASDDAAHDDASDDEASDDAAHVLPPARPPPPTASPLAPPSFAPPVAPADDDSDHSAHNPADDPLTPPGSSPLAPPEPSAGAPPPRSSAEARSPEPPAGAPPPRLRKAQREIPDSEEADQNPSFFSDAEDDGDPEAALVAEQDRSDLWQAFATLSERCRNLLRVVAVTPLESYTAVAESLGMRVGSIGPTRSRCLEHLKRALKALSSVPETTGS